METLNEVAQLQMDMKNDGDLNYNGNGPSGLETSY